MSRPPAVSHASSVAAVVLLVAATAAFVVVGASVATAAATAAQTNDTRIDRVTVRGPGVLVSDRDRLLVAAWRETTFTVSLSPAADARRVCARANASGRAVTLGCGVLQGDSRSVSISVPRWPANRTGRVALEIAVTAPVAMAADGQARRGNGTAIGTDAGRRLARAERPVTVLSVDGDFDDDGLANRAEAENGTAIRTADTDGDGLTDGVEVETYGTAPTTTDTDGDGLGDGVEVNRYGTDPTVADTDGDGLNDGTEVATYGTDPTASDTDGDGLDDAAELHRWNTNPNRADTDGDGLLDGPEVNGYGTDPTVADTDGDGLGDGAEVNRYGTDPTVADTDGDGYLDGAEVNRYGTDPARANEDPSGDLVGRDRTPTPVGPSLGFRSLLGTASMPAVLLVAGLLSGALVTCVAVAVAVGWRTDGEAADVEDAPAHPDARRVHRLLDDHDGQLPQSEIVAQTGWSKSKVSRVLSAMAEDDEVRKIRIGRENLVARPGDEPEHARGPFEN